MGIFRAGFSCNSRSWQAAQNPRNIVICHSNCHVSPCAWQSQWGNPGVTFNLECIAHLNSFAHFFCLWPCFAAFPSTVRQYSDASKNVQILRKAHINRSQWADMLSLSLRFHSLLAIEAILHREDETILSQNRHSAPTSITQHYFPTEMSFPLSGMSNCQNLD